MTNQGSDAQLHEMAAEWDDFCEAGISSWDAIGSVLLCMTALMLWVARGMPVVYYFATGLGQPRSDIASRRTCGSAVRTP